MHDQHVVTFFQKFQVVKAVYTRELSGTSDGKRYTFKVPMDIEVKVDDYCVVPNSKNCGYTVVKIVEICDDGDLDLDKDVTYKWVVQVVNVARHERLIEAEKQIVSVLKKARRRRERELRAADLMGFMSDEDKKTLEALGDVLQIGDNSDSRSTRAELS